LTIMARKDTIRYGKKLTEADMSEYLTVREVMAKLKISRTTAYGYIRKGMIRVCRFGGLVRIKPEDLERFVESRNDCEDNRGKDNG
jgi:excisionase family DNA binding protein